ncbi:MAG: three-Cys-motif partner protein TcmP [Sedimentisphaerales bacterium]|nr:three-Cys-motif partner protein TcmP [Sedimentisphaerales bacterium]
MAAGFDEIGYWSEIKLDIVRKYAAAYSKIMSRQGFVRGYYYIDAFAGAGIHLSRRTRDFVLGSPINALNVEPPFTGYYFIDLDGEKADILRELTADCEIAEVLEGDCNRILIDEVLPPIRYDAYKRALCLLDPYGLDLDWEVVRTAGKSKALEVFLNFPVMDMNRNVLWSNPKNVAQNQIARMDAYWGDKTWREAAYRKTQGLFDIMEEKTSNEIVAEAYRTRLKELAGFQYVPRPIAMRNTKGATVYYLFFASPNKTGAKIVSDIFAKYENWGAS